MAIRIAHPNCRPEVAIAALKRDLHPYLDEHEYDMTVRPPRLIRLNPRCKTPPPPRTRPTPPPTPPKLRPLDRMSPSAPTIDCEHCIRAL